MDETAVGVRPDLRIFVNAWQKNGDDDEAVQYTVTQNLNDDKMRVAKDNLMWAENREEFIILFKLCDSTGLGLEFKSNPIYMNDAGNTNCPPENIPGQPTLPDGFTIISKNKKRFKLQNPKPDATARYYKYRLRIVDRDGNRHDFDPVIQNGNGAPFTVYPSFLVPALGLIAFAGVAFFAAYAVGLVR